MSSASDIQNQLPGNVNAGDGVAEVDLGPAGIKIFLITPVIFFLFFLSILHEFVCPCIAICKILIS